MLEGPLRAIALVTALSYAGCSFSIQGPISRSDPGQCDRTAPGRKTVDVIGLLATSSVALIGMDFMSWAEVDGVLALIGVVLLLTPPILYSSALVQGTSRTSDCGRAHEHEQREAAIRERRARERDQIAPEEERRARHARQLAQARRRQERERLARERHARWLPEARRRCAADLEAWRKERGSWQKLRLYDSMPVDCQRVADEERRRATGARR